MDVASTLPLAAAHGWGGELNYIVRTLSSTIEPSYLPVGTIFLASSVLWLVYDAAPFLVEGAGIVIPTFVIGNSMQVAGIAAGGLLNLAILPILFVVYWFRDWELIFFDARFYELQTDSRFWSSLPEIQAQQKASTTTPTASQETKGSDSSGKTTEEVTD